MSTGCVALILAAFMATYWIFIYFEAEFLEPVVSIFLILSLVYVLMTWTQKTPYWQVFGAGLLLGISALVRPNALLLLPVIGLWGWWILVRRGEKRRIPLTLVGLAVGTALTVLPATIRNYVVDRDFVLISSNGGINLFMTGLLSLTNNVISENTASSGGGISVQYSAPLDPEPRRLGERAG